MNTVLEYDKEFDKVKTFLKESIDNNERMCEADLIKEENFEYLQFTTEPEAATIYGSTIGNSTVEKLRLPQRMVDRF
ncbi:uncharacterized protein OCT59_009942 [Rhizophagus irregularis]|uniref:uncharacterized protein n=1 Tax=Rhizophagus irregularis TaxID=588596 RepID=UPI001D556555|nr:hypothetical protein OCT59_009942 [Rhizophagus irregularis]CAG8706700.1 4891_t:CDS:2 [Rhizophagus irregularis]